jgi:hypothetical protein
MLDLPVDVGRGATGGTDRTVSGTGTRRGATQHKTMTRMLRRPGRFLSGCKEREVPRAPAVAQETVTVTAGHVHQRAVAPADSETALLLTPPPPCAGANRCNLQSSSDRYGPSSSVPSQADKPGPEAGPGLTQAVAGLINDDPMIMITVCQ